MNWQTAIHEIAKYFLTGAYEKGVLFGRVGITEDTTCTAHGVGKHCDGKINTFTNNKFIGV